MRDLLLPREAMIAPLLGRVPASSNALSVASCATPGLLTFVLVRRKTPGLFGLAPSNSGKPAGVGGCLRIPTNSAGYSGMMSATHSD